MKLIFLILAVFAAVVTVGAVAVAAVAAVAAVTLAKRRRDSESLDTLVESAADVEFIGSGDMARLIRDDPTTAAYFEGMTTADVSANSSTDADISHVGKSPGQRYVLSVITVNDFLMRKVKRAVSVAAHRAEFLLPRHTWRIAILADGGFGAQYPHTLGDVICLPEGLISNKEDAEEKVVRTLVHERVHVFQRLYPETTRRLLVDLWRLTRVCKWGVVVTQAALRSNPDLDGWLWTTASSITTQTEAVVSAQVYNDPTPHDLSSSSIKSFRATRDVTDNSWHLELVEQEGAVVTVYEHPYERMAYQVEEHLRPLMPSPPDEKLSDEAVDDAAALRAWIYGIRRSMT